jgi:hypothetical protein
VLVVRGEQAEVIDTGNQTVDELPVVFCEELVAGVPEQPDEGDGKGEVVETDRELVAEQGTQPWRRAPQRRQRVAPLPQDREAAGFTDVEVSAFAGDGVRMATIGGATCVDRQKRWRSNTPMALTPSDGLIFLPSARERAT